MRRTILRVILATLPLLAVGCAEQIFDALKSGDSGGKKSAKSAPAGNTGRQLADNAGNNPEVQPPEDFNGNGGPPVDPARNQPPVRNPQPPRYNPPPSNPQPSNLPAIRLSAGGAVPNSLQGGTRMFFSAEYQFVNGGPQSGRVYVCVVEGRGGKKKVRAVLPRIASRGKLPALFTPFRPDDGPFQLYIEEWQRSSGGRKPGTGRRVSNTIPLR